MNKYRDTAWLDNMARQHDIACEAYSKTLDCAAEDLARRLGHEDTTHVHHVLVTDESIENRDPVMPWEPERVALLKEVRALMGESWQLFRARIDSLSRVSDECAEEVAREKGWSADEAADALHAYQAAQKEGFSEGFGAWLASADEESRRIDAMANRYVDDSGPPQAIEGVEEIARYFLLEAEPTVGLLDAYARDSKRPSMGFVQWALKHGLASAPHLPHP